MKRLFFLASKAHDHRSGIFAGADDGFAVGDALLFAGQGACGIHLSDFQKAGNVEGSDGIFLFGIEGEVLDDVLGEDEVEHLLGVDEKAVPEDGFGSRIIVADLNEAGVVIEVVEDIGNEVLFFDLVLESFSDIVGEAVVEGFEIIIKTLTRALHAVADIRDGNFGESGVLHLVVEF